MGHTRFAMWCVPTCVLQVTPAAAQFNNGEVTGVVKDSSGGVLPGTMVTVRHAGTVIICPLDDFPLLKLAELSQQLTAVGTSPTAESLTTVGWPSVRARCTA